MISAKGLQRAWAGNKSTRSPGLKAWILYPEDANQALGSEVSVQLFKSGQYHLHKGVEGLGGGVHLTNPNTWQHLVHLAGGSG